jgi:hypothetical protein
LKNDNIQTQKANNYIEQPLGHMQTENKQSHPGDDDEIIMEEGDIFSFSE